ncbi:hypothetical protein [Synechococcus phage S-SRP01]|uniref:Uncharacterized protein n=1 Tax=Synechococcus phage S-SRP01 TaxID=2781607 RepID=A0A874MA98_9CAUD|nr:hypothetical protein [Synechococcus phage S-SRP01]
MQPFFSVTRQVIITINGRQHVIESCDFSESVTEAIADCGCGDSDDEILYYVEQN